MAAGKLKQAVARIKNMFNKGLSFVKESDCQTAGLNVDKFLILVSGFG